MWVTSADPGAWIPKQRSARTTLRRVLARVYGQGMPWRVYLMLLAVGAVAAGCGGSKPAATTVTTSQTGTTPTQTSTSTGTTTTSTTTASGGIDTMAGASTKPVVVKATNTQTALLTDVRAARHEGYDRVVFQFSNAVPGYDVRYVERPIVEDGSGRTVNVDGAYVVRVRMENGLDADLSKASAPRTYTGPNRLAPGTPEVASLVRTGGFENVLTWAVGLRDRVDFRVLTLDSPPRLIVDFRNH